MFSESDLIPLSAIQHYRYCPRQCGLIHLEQQWAENRFTAEGRIMHEHVNAGGHSSRATIRTEFSVRLRSLALGLSGVADVVEYHVERAPDGKVTWRPHPVEYKRGKRKPDSVDEVQLCAQAMALEEMTGLDITRGSIYYGKERHRNPVEFTEVLRKETSALAAEVHELLSSNDLPPPVKDGRCNQCSLHSICMPTVVCGSPRIQRWFEREIEGMEDE